MEFLNTDIPKYMRFKELSILTEWNAAFKYTTEKLNILRMVQITDRTLPRRHSLMQIQFKMHFFLKVTLPFERNDAITLLELLIIFWSFLDLRWQWYFSLLHQKVQNGTKIVTAKPWSKANFVNHHGEQGHRHFTGYLELEGRFENIYVLSRGEKMYCNIKSTTEIEHPCTLTKKIKNFFLKWN